MTGSRAALAAFVLSSAVIVFLSGVAVGRYRIFPYSWLEFGKASFEQVRGELSGELLIEQHSPARYLGAGVTTNRPTRTVSGLTLLAGFFDGANELRLVRMDGSVLHRWKTSLATAVATTGHIKPASMIPRTDVHTDIHGAVALPDGSVVFNYHNVATVKLDRCGIQKWTVLQMTHHAVSLSEDGGFWIPSQRYVERNSLHPLIAPPYLEPTVIKVGPDGSVRSEISVLRLLLDNRMESQLLVKDLSISTPLTRRGLFGVPGDVVHLNDVEELTTAMAHAFPQFRAGSLLLSLRDYNMVLVMNPSTMKVTWSHVGPWINQHDPDFNPNGTISVFNNNYDGTPDGSLLGGSTIVVLDPSTGESSIRYGASNQRMFSGRMGKHQYLDGNILITEARSGRVIEVDGDGHIVWEFINRVDETTVSDVTEAIRYRPDYFTVTDWACR